MKYLILFFISLNIFAGGNEGGGGGDPVAAKFSSLASYISDYLASNATKNPTVSRTGLAQLALDIKNSLHVSSQVGRIEVVDEILPNATGDLFLKTQRTPVYIQIYKPVWDKLNDKQILKAVTDLMIKMVTEDQDTDIPLPADAVDTYAFVYQLCEGWTGIVQKGYETLLDGLSNCDLNNSSQLVPILYAIGKQLKSNVQQCQNICVFHGQQMNGHAICTDYLEQHQQDIRTYRSLKKGCIGL